MSHSYMSNRVHFVFSTHERTKTIPADLQPGLWAYMAGVARKLGSVVFEVGGIDNHVHVFATLPATTTASEFVQKIKANSSRWMHENGPAGFRWQEGYSGFSVSASATDAVRNYVHDQPDHHRQHSFEDELLSLLKRYGISYDSQQVFG